MSIVPIGAKTLCHSTAPKAQPNLTKLALIALGLVVAYVIYNAYNKNKVKEKCFTHFDPQQCSQAVATTVGQTALSVGPLVKSCLPNPLTVDCLTTGATVLLSTTKQS